MSETKVNLGLGGLRPEVVPGAKERDRVSDPRTRQKRQRMRAILLPRFPPYLPSLRHDRQTHGMAMMTLVLSTAQEGAAMC